LVEYLREISGLNFVIDVGSLAERPVTLQVEDLSLESVLLLILDPFGLRHVVGEDGVIRITGAKAAPRERNAPCWMAPGVAAAFQRMIADLASSDPAAQQKAAEELVAMGDEALAPLLQAARLLDAEAAARCAAARARILSQPVESDHNEAVVPEWTAAQKEILERKIDVDAQNVALGEFLATKGAFRAKADARLTLRVSGVRLGTLLRALTRPYGLDFYMDGETVVIDTADKVRAAVEK
jgi:hypothetical protein